MLRSLSGLACFAWLLLCLFVACMIQTSQTGNCWWVAAGLVPGVGFPCTLQWMAYCHRQQTWLRIRRGPNLVVRGPR